MALESVEKDGRGGTNAVIYTDDDARESIPPPGKFYCDNCSKYFDTPKFIK